MGSRVLDIGGGTGLVAHAFQGRQYICLDVDLDKLRGLNARLPDCGAVAGDATRPPIADGSIDVVVCTKVTHHLDDRQLTAMLAETARIHRVGGTLVLADAVASDRVMSRLLWAFDRGSYPRPLERLSGFLTSAYRVAHQQQFRLGLFHDFWLCVAERTRGSDT